MLVGCNCGGRRSVAARSPQGVPETFKVTLGNRAVSFHASREEAEGRYEMHVADDPRRAPSIRLDRVNARQPNQVIEALRPTGEELRRLQERAAAVASS